MTPFATKLVCTVGPASDSPEMIRAFVDAGMNVARLNFSHGSHDDHARRIGVLREVARERGVPVAILQDLQGPKIRVGQLQNGGMTLTPGNRVTLRFGAQQTGPEIPIDYAHLASDVQPGARILLDDGLMAMKVESLAGEDVICEVIHGGFLKPRKGVNFPDSHLSIPATTEKDIQDLFFGVSQAVDYVALSFVQSAADVVELKRQLKAFGGEGIPVVAKIEMKRAIENLDAICAESDAIMVARGDLGVECGFASVSAYQKRIIKAARRAGKPVIVATQMLDSMQEQPTPTKAEVLDVANAVYDLADATMLSGESASGKYPLLAVETMRDITSRVDAVVGGVACDWEPPLTNDTSDVIAHSAADLARKSEVKAIVCLTLTGTMALIMARQRPPVPIFALSPRPDVVRRLALVRNIHPILNTEFFGSEKAILSVGRQLAARGLVKQGDKIIITAGLPLKDMRKTNSVKLHEISADDVAANPATKEKGVQP